MAGVPPRATRARAIIRLLSVAGNGRSRLQVKATALSLDAMPPHWPGRVAGIASVDGALGQ